MNPGALKVSPTPTTVDIGETELGGRRYIVMSVSTLTGVQVYFLAPQEARAIAEYLGKLAASDVLFVAPQGAPV